MALDNVDFKQRCGCVAGYWPVPSPGMKPCNLESFFFYISVMKNLTDFRKLVETGVDLCLH